eukprot:TRINITY_DN6456_c0_g1_i1.p2 TRINITY_DN6456_c0_g1~~TRINITY_DN6456_c0_g1_i1.p2  ORF type:complete len:175 (-),score=35.94 TRINITY_DN6456_c0_g1_i1:1166-1690(-)
MPKPKLEESPNHKAKCRKCNCYIKPGMLRLFVHDDSGWQKYGKYAKGTEGEGRGYVETEFGVFRRDDKYYIHLRCFKVAKRMDRDRSLFSVAKLSAEGEKALADWPKGPPPAKPKKPSKYEFYEEVEEEKESAKPEEPAATARAARKKKRDDAEEPVEAPTDEKAPPAKRRKRV